MQLCGGLHKSDRRPPEVDASGLSCQQPPCICLDRLFEREKMKCARLHLNYPMPHGNGRRKTLQLSVRTDPSVLVIEALSR